MLAATKRSCKLQAEDGLSAGHTTRTLCMMQPPADRRGTMMMNVDGLRRVCRCAYIAVVFDHLSRCMFGMLLCVRLCCTRIPGIAADCQPPAYFNKFDISWA
jgi:hypothetical protein